jgi:hypothetical protein
MVENDEEKKLLELYKLAIDIDKYELDLRWKLVQFFTVLNTGILTLGFTLLGSDQLSQKYYVIPIFIIGIAIAIIAIGAHKNYHKHSLRAEYKRTLIEDRLKLYDTFEKYGYSKHTLAISTSSRNDPSVILRNPEEWIKNNTLKPGTVPFYHNMVFWFFVGMNSIGILIITYSDASTYISSLL